MPQIAQKTQRRQSRRETIFPDSGDLEVFLERVARHAPQCGVSPVNVRRLVSFLRKKYGKGLPREETFASAVK